MVWPQTKCSPSMRMARSTPRRIRGSPPCASMRAITPAKRPSLTVPTSLPVIIKPHAAALTNSGRSAPICADHWACPSLSRIRASRVASSGIRNRASARHISATPSSLDSENSWISAVMPGLPWRALPPPGAAQGLVRSVRPPTRAAPGRSRLRHTAVRVRDTQPPRPHASAPRARVRRKSRKRCQETGHSVGLLC